LRRERDALEKEVNLLDKADPPQTAAMRLIDFSNKNPGGDPITQPNEWSSTDKKGCCG